MPSAQRVLRDGRYGERVTVEKPTEGELERVRRWECEQSGHTFTEVVQGYDPVTIVCTNCGESWDVKPKGPPQLTVEPHPIMDRVEP
jgi:hypothetical protein